MLFVVPYYRFFFLFFFFKQKTAYEMRISDWSSDVCSSDLDFDIQPTLSSYYELTHRAAGGTYELLAFSEQRIEQRIEQLVSRTVIAGLDLVEIGRASCRERVCQYV